MRKGIKLLEEILGDGPVIERHRFYQLSLRYWLNHGDPIYWAQPEGLCDRYRILDGGKQLISDFRFDREFLISGIFYGIEGMRIGGTRKLKISPHLAYRDQGIEGRIPPNSVIIVQVQVIEERKMKHY